MSVDWSALRTPDFAGNALKFQAAGQEQQQVNAKQNALRTYATDPSAGISQLMAVDPVTATTLSKAHRQDQQDQARQVAAAKFAAGDVSGAQQAVLPLGDDDMLKAIGTMSEQQKTEAHQRADSLASVIVGLQKLPYEQRKQRLAEIAPSAQTLGLTAEQVTNYDPTDANNQAMIGHVLGTKALLERSDKLSKPLEMDPSKRYYLPNDGSAPPDAGAPAASAAPPMATDGPSPASAPSGAAQVNPDAVWRSIKTQESGGEAHPGSAVGPDTAYGNALGSTQMLPATAESMARKVGLPWNPALMRENSPRALEYQDKLGRAYFDEGLQKSGGDPAAAAAYYFGGPDPALHGPKTHAYVQQVIARAGGQGGDVQPYQVAANGPTPPPPSIPGYHLIQTEQPKEPAWKPDGKGNLINTATGDRKVDPTASGADASDPNIVKGLIEGRIMPPTQKAAATPYWQAQLTAAAAQDPTFDQVNFGARSKTRADFTSGKSAQNVTALNTVIGHLDHLDRTIGSLGNLDGGTLGPLTELNNKAAHFLANTSGTNTRYKDFETAKTAVANELTRVFRGSGGAEADIQGWMKQLDSASSPQALHGVVRSMAELINSRVEALGEQYSQGMGTTKDPITLLTPDKQTMFNRLMGAADHTAAPGTAPAAPVGHATLPPQAASQLKDGHVTTFANGQKWTLHNGQPAQVN